MSTWRAVWADYRGRGRGGFLAPARHYLLGELLAWTALGIFQVLFNLYLVEQHFQPAFIGRAISFHGLGLALAALPAGLLAERWGRRRTPHPRRAPGRHRARAARRAPGARADPRRRPGVGLRAGAARDRRRTVPDRALDAARAHAPVQRLLRELAARGRGGQPARRLAAGRGARVAVHTTPGRRRRVPRDAAVRRHRSRCWRPRRWRGSAISKRSASRAFAHAFVPKIAASSSPSRSTRS